MSVADCWLVIKVLNEENQAQMEEEWASLNSVIQMLETDFLEQPIQHGDIAQSVASSVKLKSNALEMVSLPCLMM